MCVRDDKSILISGDAPIETLAELLEDFELDFEKIDYSTVAGFVFSLINKIPQVGDKIEYGEYLIEIVYGYQQNRQDTCNKENLRFNYMLFLNCIEDYVAFLPIVFIFIMYP